MCAEHLPNNATAILVVRTIVAAIISCIAFLAVVIIIHLAVDYVTGHYPVLQHDPLVRIIVAVGSALFGVGAARALCDTALADYSNKTISVVFVIVFGASFVLFLMLPADPDSFVTGNLVFAGVAMLLGGTTFWPDTSETSGGYSLARSRNGPLLNLRQTNYCCCRLRRQRMTDGRDD